MSALLRLSNMEASGGEEWRDLVSTVAEDHDFLIFCQPVALYSKLSARHKKKPAYLKRTISYCPSSCMEKDAAPVINKFQVKLYNFNCESVKPASPEPLTHTSVFAVLSAASPNENEFRPKLVKMIHLERDIEASSSWQDFRVCTNTYGDLHLLLIVWDSHSDLTCLSQGKNDAKQMNTGWKSGKLFGCIPDKSNIWWATLRLDGNNHTGSTVILQQAIVKASSDPRALDVAAAAAKPSLPSTIVVCNGAHTGETRAWSQAVLCTDVIWGAAPPEPEAAAAEPITGMKRRRLWSEAERVQQRARLLPVKEDMVCFRYHLRDAGKYFDETVSNNACPFCRLRCSSMEALKVHVHASHPAFDYELEMVGKPDSTDKMYMMHVYVRNGIFDDNGYYHDPETESYKTQHRSKAFFYHVSTYRKYVDTLLGRPQDHNLPHTMGVLNRVRPVGEENGTGSRNDDASNDVSYGSSARGDQRKRMKVARARHGVERSEVLERSYFHSKTAMPMRHEEVEAGLDSDNDEDFAMWEKRQRMDLHAKKEMTPEDRRLILMWNTFAYNHPVHADYFIPATCDRFSQRYATELRAEGMRRAFVKHMLMLWDYALLDPPTIERCLRVVDGKLPGQPGPGKRAAGPPLPQAFAGNTPNSTPAASAGTSAQPLPASQDGAKLALKAAVPGEPNTLSSSSPIPATPNAAPAAAEQDNTHPAKNTP